MSPVARLTLTLALLAVAACTSATPAEPSSATPSDTTHRTTGGSKPRPQPQ